MPRLSIQCSGISQAQLKSREREVFEAQQSLISKSESRLINSILITSSCRRCLKLPLYCAREGNSSGAITLPNFVASCLMVNWTFAGQQRESSPRVGMPIDRRSQFTPSLFAADRANSKFCRENLLSTIVIFDGVLKIQHYCEFIKTSKNSKFK